MSNEKVQSDYIYDEVSDEEARKFNLDPYMINFLTHEPLNHDLLRMFLDHLP